VSPVQGAAGIEGCRDSRGIGSCASILEPARTDDPASVPAPTGRRSCPALQAEQHRLAADHGPAVAGHRPSINVLFESAAKALAADAVGVLLTGMGSDGATGLATLRAAGARTIAQDEATCVVFGMPGEAVKLGAADHVTPLPDIAALILRVSSERPAARPSPMAPKASTATR
jgi:two-component system, chemotaxis family, protein-glutamate methylesterase/glutaminase